MYCNRHRCDQQEWCKIVKKECPEKHKWGSMILPFYDIDAFPPVELLSGHQWEDSGRTGRPLVEMCQTGCWKMILIRFVKRIRRRGCWWGWFRSLGAWRKTTGDGAEGRLLWYSWRSATFQTVRWLPSHQPTASVINRKGSHVKKKPFQLQPRELQCRTHTYIHTSKNTFTHKQVHMVSVRVQRLISVTTRVEVKAWHLAPTLQLSACYHLFLKYSDRANSGENCPDILRMMSHREHDND